MKALRPVLLALALVGSPALAVEPGEMLPDPALEQRARDISTGLRCLVCQNQSIDDSEAALARDLRMLVRERLAAGDSDEGVRAFLQTRYGPYILLKPPFAVQTLLLWLTPLACLLAGGTALLAAARRRRAAPETGLAAQEEAALERILGRETGSR